MKKKTAVIAGYNPKQLGLEIALLKLTRLFERPKLPTVYQVS